MMKKAKQTKEEKLSKINEALDSLNKGDKDTATSIAIDILKKNPNDINALQILGTLYFQNKEYQKALEFMQKVYLQNPKDTNINKNLGVIYRWLQDYQKSIEHFQKSLNIDPNNTESLGGLGGVYILLNKYNEAYSCFKKVIGLNYNPANYYSLSCCKFFKNQNDEDLKLIEDAYHNHKSDNDQMYLNFALGNANDNLKNYDEAFKYYKTANDIINKINSFNITKMRHEIEVFKSIDISLLKKLAKFGSLDERPTFILGMSRSGKSLLEKVLSISNKTHPAGEIDVLGKFIGQINQSTKFKTDLNSFLESTDPSIFKEMQNSYLKRILRDVKNESIVIDTMPVNFITLWLIQIIFPKAKIIHMTRNPLDNCLFMYFKYYILGNTYSYDLENTANYYLAHHEIMQHWKNNLDLEILDVKYEDLIQNYKNTINKVCDFLNIETSISMFNFNFGKIEDCHSKSADNEFIISIDEINHYKYYEKYLTNVKKILKDIIEE